MKENITAAKSIDFAIKIIQLYKKLVEEKGEYVMSKQLLRSGTAIGALIKEAEHAESKADFLHKMNIALKEANETSYWLFLLHKGGYISESVFNETNDDCLEIIRLLASIVKTTKANLGR
jgi:four helix bundle protein